MKKILVTGGCGFIGSFLIKKLLKNKNNFVLNLDALKKQSVPESLNEIKKNKNYKFLKVDITNYKKTDKIISQFKPNLIYHLAAESHVDRSIVNPTSFILSNINATLSILESLRNNDFWKNDVNFKLINVSTDEVFGSLSKKQKSFTEKNKFLPNSPYSSSKASSDLIVRSYFKTFNIPIITTNCSNNYGPWQFPEKLIPVVIASCLNNKVIPIYGNGKNIRDWLYVGDHINALVKIAKIKDYGSSYNIGGGVELSNIQIVRHICKIMNDLIPNSRKYSSLIKFVKDRKSHDFRYSVNIDKIQKKINYKPLYSFDDGLRETVSWYISNSKWLNKKIN